MGCSMTPLHHQKQRWSKVEQVEQKPALLHCSTTPPPKGGWGWWSKGSKTRAGGAVQCPNPTDQTPATEPR